MRRRPEAVRAGQPAFPPALLPALLAALWTAAPAPVLAADWTAPFYIATDLGGFVSNGTPLNFATDLTNAGAAVGYSLVASEQFGLFWPAGGTRQAVTLNGQLLAANDLGVWVGAQNGQMTRWVDGLAEVIDTRVNSVAQLVNNPGWVVGQAPGAGTLLWRAGLGETPITGIGLARALNDNGVVAGFTPINGGQRAAYWTLADGLSTVAVAGGNSELRDINNGGVFVGDVVRSGGTRSFIGSIGGSVADLVLPAGYTSSHVWAINDRGLAVGLVSSDPGNLTAGSSRVALWQDGGVRVLDVHGATVFNWAGFVDINDSGQILVGANVGSSAFSPAHASFILTPCTRCGQIHPNPNPDGQVISLDPDWSTPFNGEDFDNRGAILVNSMLDNLPRASLATMGTGFIDVNGRLRNAGRMTFEDRGAGAPSLRVAGASGLLDMPDGGTLNTRGTVQVRDGAQVLVYSGARWTSANGALLDIGGTASPVKAEFAMLGDMDNAQGALLRVNAGDGRFVLGLNATLRNHGVLQFSSDAINLGGQIENFIDGLITIESQGGGAPASVQTLSAKIFNSGRLHIGVNADLRLQNRLSSLVNFAQVDIDGGGQLLNSGLVYGESGSSIVVAAGGLVFNSRDLWINHGAQLHIDDDGHRASLNNIGAATLPALFFNAGTAQLTTVQNATHDAIRNTGTLVIAGRLDNLGSFQNLGGGDAEVGRLVNTGVVSNATTAWEIDAAVGPRPIVQPGGLPATLHFTGPVTNLPGATVLLFNGSSTRFSDRFENSGLVEVLGDLQGDTPLADYVQLSGITHVNGTLSAQHIDCQAGTFHGTGTLVAPGGIRFGACDLSPGNSPGQLTLLGDAEFDGTTFAMEVGAAAADRLVIDGRVVLRNARITLSFLDGAMPDPLQPIALFATRSDCAGCDSAADLPLTVLGAPAGWQGSFSTGVVSGGGLGQVTLSLSNPDAQVLQDDLRVVGVFRVDAGTVVMHANATQIAPAALFDNQGAFYNLGDGRGGGPALVNDGRFVNRTGAGLLNRGLVLNHAVLVNEAGAAFNNRGSLHNIDGDAHAVLLNQGRFNNGPEAVLRNGDAGTGQGGLIVNDRGGVLVNHGLILNRGAPQIVNRGQFDNHGVIDSDALVVNDGGVFTIHATGQLTGGGRYRQEAGAAEAGTPARTIVNGLLQAQVQLAAGTRLGGSGTVVGPVQGGTITPGDGVGTLTLDGSLTGASYEIDVADSGDVDHLLVSGLAELGTTRVVFAAGYLPRDGQHLRWLQAGRLTGIGGTPLAGVLADPQWLSFAMLAADGTAVALVEPAPVRLQDGQAWHLLDVGGRRLLAAAEIGADGVGLVFRADLPAPVPEPPALALWLAGLAGLLARVRPVAQPGTARPCASQARATLRRPALRNSVGRMPACFLKKRPK